MDGQAGCWLACSELAVLFVGLFLIQEPVILLFIVGFVAGCDFVAGCGYVLAA